MIRHFSLILFLFASVASTAQTSFSSVVDGFLQKPAVRNASVGIHVADLESGAGIFGLNEEKCLIPASTMKLVTSAAALEILGDDYRFETRLGYRGRLNSKGTLKGDLVLIGGGDPALGSEYFRDHYFNFPEKWAQVLKRSGITRVDGDLLLDASIYDQEPVPATWIWEDLGNYYGAGPSAFSVYDNMFRITFRSPKRVGEATEIIATYPKIDGMEIDNRVLSSAENRDLAYVFGSPLDKNRLISGTIPADRKAFTIKAAIPNPGEVLAQEFFKALAREGVFISGKIRFKKVDEADFEQLFVQQSPRLAQIVDVLNHESVNLFAEHLLKQIAYEKTGLGTREAGIALVRDFWVSKGLETAELFMEDGSGLSHFNAASPKFFTRLLLAMDDRPTFVNSLPAAGNGTLAWFDKSLFPGSTIQAKSGSMTRVRCYAGYLRCDSGKEVAFSIMVNHFSGSQVAMINDIQQLLVALKREN